MTDFSFIESLLRENKSDEAFSLLASILEENPELANGWHYMGCLKMAKGDQDYAGMCFKKAIELDPRHDRAMYNWGNIYRITGQYDEAEKMFARVKEIIPDAQIPDVRPPKRVVYIGLPHYGSMKAEFMQSLIAMLLTIKQQDNIQFIIRDCMGSRITSNRNRLVQDAMKNGATHILFLDNDMVFPSFLLHRFLSYNLDIISATACKRGDETGTPIGVAVAPPDSTGTHKIISAGQGLVEMALIGSCCQLIKLTVFQTIGMPAFYEPPNYADGDAFGEDITFCKLVRKSGFKIWMDFDMSTQLGHVGEKTFYIKPNTIKEDGKATDSTTAS